MFYSNTGIRFHLLEHAPLAMAKEVPCFGETSLKAVYMVFEGYHRFLHQYR